MAHTLFRGRVRIGYLAAIVAASNAGGSGSVIGDTTTTMMWISGVSPLAVLHAYVAAAVAFLVFGLPAARAQQRYAPILKDPPGRLAVDWPRVAIVVFILASAVAVNVGVNAAAPRTRGAVSLHRLGGRGRGAAHERLAPTRLGRHAGRGQGLDLSALPRRHRITDAGGLRCPRRPGRAPSRSASFRHSSTTSR